MNPPSVVTAAYVVRHAACPVLVVPSHERPKVS
jgi:hypothetical protein